ncbi:hypothetical protein HPP92_003834 [Vanilla planifolia]|uniref:GrpE protein homolog n=1 Tax=Vanilla planifolia TaxID=51239 RepID=A0A835S8A3_VANPL|nr:hypothetical protein HPP92_003834 [Vanilla planifolia]
MASRLLCRIPRTAGYLLVRASSRPEGLCSISRIEEASLSSSKWLISQKDQWRSSHFVGSISQRFGYSSSASAQATQDKINWSEDQDDVSREELPEPSQNSSGVLDMESAEDSGNSTFQKEFVDEDMKAEVDVKELIKLIAEKDELLNRKKKEIEIMQDKVLRTYAERENVLERTKREVENSKKYGIQNFAKSLLDVADNLGRASSAAKTNISKIEKNNDSIEVLLLKSLLEGVEMTEKQLMEVFRKFGIEKYDPLNESFDPNRIMQFLKSRFIKASWNCGCSSKAGLPAT